MAQDIEAGAETELERDRIRRQESEGASASGAGDRKRIQDGGVGIRRRAKREGAVNAIEARDAVDLDVDTFPVRVAPTQVRVDFLAMKKSRKASLNAGKSSVSSAPPDVHDVREIQPAAASDAPEVCEGLPRLLADTASPPPSFSDRPNPGPTRKQIPRADRLGERRGRALVGEARGGAPCEVDDLLRMSATRTPP